MSDRSARSVWLAAGLLLWGGGAVAQQEGVPIRGVVVDRRDAPVEGARLGTGWWFDHDRLSAYGAQYVWPADTTRDANGWRFIETEADGCFDARILPRRGMVQLTVFSADGELAGTFVWNELDDLTDLKLTIEPVARFRATITCDELGRREVPATAYLNSFDGRRLGRFLAREGTIDLRLPPGHFSLYLYGASRQDITSRRFQFAVAAGEDANARDIDIPANNIAKMRGRTMPPWHATASRGIALADAEFDYFRGKWLLVHIWQLDGHAPRRSFPRYLAFDREWRQQHAGEEPPYAIVLLHNGGPKSFAEYDAQVAKLGHRDAHWGGEPLPFPILLDPDERTVAAWKPRWSGVALLFDPDGKLWGETDLDSELRRIVAGTIEPATPEKVRKSGR